MRLPILVLHIFAGTLGLLSGTVAMSFRKGSRGHRVAGNVFVISMLSMAAAAVYLAAMKHDNNNIGGGILAFYLVATAWATATHRDGETSIFDWGALLVPLALGIGSWIHGIQNGKGGDRRGSSPRWNDVFHGFHVAACRSRGRSHAGARRRFRHAARRAASLAYVPWAVHRHGILIHGTTTSIPRLLTRNTFYPGLPATDIADFLANPSSL
jgi:hypothetical protein